MGAYREALALKWLEQRLPDLPIECVQTDSLPLALSSRKEEEAFTAWKVITPDVNGLTRSVVHDPGLDSVGSGVAGWAWASGGCLVIAFT